MFLFCSDGGGPPFYLPMPIFTPHQELAVKNPISDGFELGG